MEVFFTADNKTVMAYSMTQCTYTDCKKSFFTLEASCGLTI